MAGRMINGWAIDFDPIAHEYSDAAGVIPGVSGIIKAAGKCRAYPDNGDTTARDRGTRIHEATEAMDILGLTPLDFDDDEMYPHLCAWREWRADFRGTLLRVETLLWHGPLRYAGTVDRVIQGETGTFIVDLKTGGKAPWHRLQLAAYALAYEWETGIKPIAGIAVYTKKTGRYTTDPVTGAEWAEAMELWQQIAKNHKESNK